MHFRGPVRIELVQRWQYVERSRHVWWCSDPTLTGGKNQLQTHRRWASRESLCLWSAQPTGNVNSAYRVPSSRPCVTFIEVSTNSPVLGKERSECGWRVQVESGEDSGSGLPSEKGERRALLFPPASFCKHKWGGLWNELCVRRGGPPYCILLFLCTGRSLCPTGWGPVPPCSPGSAPWVGASPAPTFYTCPAGSARIWHGCRPWVSSIDGCRPCTGRT